MIRFALAMAAALVLSGCNIEQGLRRNEDRYAVRGAMDFPLTGIYSTYQYELIGRYRITHQWLNSSSCQYGAIERPAPPGARRSNFYDASAIYEVDGITKQVDEGAKNFNRFVSSWPQVSRTKETYGQKKDSGFYPICFESWARTSHFLCARLHRVDPATWRRMAETERNPKGDLPIVWRPTIPTTANWTERTVGQYTWTVMEVAEENLVAPPLNGVGGAYRAWLLPLADSGYTLSFELGANTESLRDPKANAQFLAVLQHLVESVRIEALPAAAPAATR